MSIQLGEIVEKLQLVNFISKVMEESGFKVYKDFKTSQKVIDIYGILPSVMGDFSVVVACKNYDKQWEVGIDILKEMEMIGRNLKASKVVIVTSSIFSSQSRNYASKKNIKLIDRDNLMILAKKFSKKASSSHNSHNYVNPDSNSHDSFENPHMQSSEMKKKHGNNLNDNYDDSDSYHDNYYSADSNNNPETAYRDNSTFISGKSSMGLNKQRSNSNSTHSSVSRDDSKLAKRKPKKQGPSLSQRILPILNNTIVLIILVVLVSYLISSLLVLTTGTSNGISGLIKILSSLALSYGLVLVLNKDGTAVLVKGTTVFFVSLIILILMIIVL